MESDQKHLTALTNIPLKSTLSEISSSESSSSKDSPSLEIGSLSKSSSLSESSSSESSLLFETNSSKSSLSNSDINEIVNTIKYQRI